VPFDHDVDYRYYDDWQARHTSQSEEEWRIRDVNKDTLIKIIEIIPEVSPRFIKDYTDRISEIKEKLSTPTEEIADRMEKAANKFRQMSAFEMPKLTNKKSDR